jgi:hypothetical protein
MNECKALVDLYPKGKSKHSERSLKHINKTRKYGCLQNPELLNLTAGGIYDNHGVVHS